MNTPLNCSQPGTGKTTAQAMVAGLVSPGRVLVIDAKRYAIGEDGELRRLGPAEPHDD